MGGVSEIRVLYGLIVALVLTTFLELAHSSTPDGLAMSFGYQAVSPFASYPGGSVILGVGIQNTGTAQERIIEMSITTDFAGPLPPPTQIPFVLSPGIRREFDVLVQVPPATSVGGHGAEARVSYEYLDPATQQWVPSTHSPRIMDSGVPVYESPSQKVRDGFSILGGTVLVSGAIPFFAWKRKISFAFVGRGLGLVGGAFGLLISPLTLIHSGQVDPATSIFSVTLFVGSSLGIAGGYFLRVGTRVRGLVILVGALAILPAWWFGDLVSLGLSSEDGGAQVFLSSTILFFWWVSLLIVGSLMMTFGRNGDAVRGSTDSRVQQLCSCEPI